jgi:hypothetical protein
MKLTKDKLRQIIKEELEELMSVKEVKPDAMIGQVGGGLDEPSDEHVPPPSSKTQNISGPPPLAKEIFSLQSNDPKMVALINTIGNLISSFETGASDSLKKHDVNRLKDLLSGK